MMRALWPCLIFALLSGAAAGGELRLLGYDEKTRDPACIGNPVTQVCALETYFTCFLYGEWSKCRNLRHTEDEWTGKSPGLYMLFYRYRYEIVSRRIVDEVELKRLAPLRHADLLRQGDHVLTVMWDGCRPDGECITRTRNDPTVAYGTGCGTYDYCGRDPDPYHVVMRSFPDGTWGIVTDYVDSELSP